MCKNEYEVKMQAMDLMSAAINDVVCAMDAVTRASQDVESYDRATALEGIGWQIMQRRELYV